MAINPDTGAETKSFSRHHESVVGITIQNSGLHLHGDVVSCAVRTAVPQTMTVYIKDYEELLCLMEAGR